MIRIEKYDSEQIKALVDSKIDFNMDSTEKLNIKIPKNALDIILKQAMYAEEISETLTGKKTTGKKTAVKCRLPIAPDHEKKIGEYFWTTKTDGDFAYILLKLKDQRGGYNKFTKEQVKFILEVTQGEIIDREIEEVEDLDKDGEKVTEKNLPQKNVEEILTSSEASSILENKTKAELIVTLTAMTNADIEKEYGVSAKLTKDKMILAVIEKLYGVENERK